MKLKKFEGWRIEFCLILSVLINMDFKEGSEHPNDWQIHLHDYQFRYDEKSSKLLRNYDLVHICSCPASKDATCWDGHWSPVLTVLTVDGTLGAHTCLRISIIYLYLDTYTCVCGRVHLEVLDIRQYVQHRCTLINPRLLWDIPISSISRYQNCPSNWNSCPLIGEAHHAAYKFYVAPGMQYVSLHWFRGPQIKTAVAMDIYGWWFSECGCFSK